MKAVLVIDMPGSCFHCPLESYSNQCGANHENTAGNANKIPSWCPLKPIPERKPTDFLNYWFNQGWNALHEELVGEDE